MFFKTKIFIIFVMIAVGMTFYHFGDPTKLLNSTLEVINKTPLRTLVQKFDNVDQDNMNFKLQDTIQNAQTEILSLSERSKEVQKHTSNILGSSIEATDDAVPIHEKALEYGKYIYCKTVVNDYETQHNQSVNP